MTQPGLHQAPRPLEGETLGDRQGAVWWLPSGVRVVGRTVTIDIRLQGIARVLLPVVPGLVRSAYRKNLTGLKAVLEAQPPLPGVK